VEVDARLGVATVVTIDVATEEGDNVEGPDGTTTGPTTDVVGRAALAALPVATVVGTLPADDNDDGTVAAVTPDDTGTVAGGIVEGTDTVLLGKTLVGALSVEGVELVGSIVVPTVVELSATLVDVEDVEEPVVVGAGTRRCCRCRRTRLRRPRSGFNDASNTTGSPSGSCTMRAACDGDKNDFPGPDTNPPATRTAQTPIARKRIRMIARSY
jgi:hypothetical protein